MKNIGLVLAALASTVATPAMATTFYNGFHHGCGDSGHCTSALKGDFTYDGNGGSIKDATIQKVHEGRSYNWITTPSTFTSSINVTDSFTLADVNVSLNQFKHDSWNDLKISLTHGSSVVWLVSNQGGYKQADGNYIFDDSGLTEIGASNGHWRAGTYQPDGSLSLFNGMDSKGLWTLNIYDTKHNGADGQLCDWTLQLTPTPTSAVPEPATWAMMVAGFGLVGMQLRRRRPLGAAMVRA